MFRALAQTWTRFSDTFRRSLSFRNALPQLSILAVLIGVIASLVIAAFRMLIDLILIEILDGEVDAFEKLSSLERSGLIIVGIAALSLVLYRVKSRRREMSVAHVIDRLTNHQGYIHWKNTVLQFFCGVIAMVSGQSVGREGPAVHLGAGVASILGRAMRLPNNSAPTLIGCGVSASIAASFNTPMAAVIFALEVVVLEYSGTNLIPIILAAVVGALINQAIFDEPLYTVVTTVGSIDFIELPFLIVLGALLSIAAALYIRLNITTLKFAQKLLPSLPMRLACAGMLTLLVALVVPEVMGLGYDSINSAINLSSTLQVLVAVGFAKLFLTPIVCGMGVPGGAIGPMLIVGACLGAAFGLAANASFGIGEGHLGLYAALGMAGMMAATLNAPLASLITVLELSYNPQLVFPAMLIIVVACIGTRYSFGLEGLFVEQLKHSRRELDFSPARVALRRIGISSVLDRNLVMLPKRLDYEEAKAALASNPRWCVFEDNNTINNSVHALMAADLSRFLDEAPVAVLSLEEQVDLFKIPGRRIELIPIHETANLDEALTALRETERDALYVRSSGLLPINSVKGLVTIEAIENFYLPH